MNKLELWKTKSDLLKILKVEEMELRKEICSEISTAIGTTRSEFLGKTVKSVQKLSLSIDEAALGTIWEMLPPEEKACIRLKPTLKAGPYKKLEENSILHEAVISKLGAPTLEIAE